MEITSKEDKEKPLHTSYPIKDENIEWVRNNKEKVVRPKHLTNTFQLNSPPTANEEYKIENYLDFATQLNLPIKKSLRINDPNPNLNGSNAEMCSAIN